MSQGKVKLIEVFRDAENIYLEEIVWESEATNDPTLKVRVNIDGRAIEDVTFKRDIASNAYATPPLNQDHRSDGSTILFGGDVQEILDCFADQILPTMKPLGVYPFIGENVLDCQSRTDTPAIEETKQKINSRKFVWQKRRS